MVNSPPYVGNEVRRMGESGSNRETAIAFIQGYMLGKADTPKIQHRLLAILAKPSKKVWGAPFAEKN